MRSRALVELDGGLVGMHVSGVDIAPRLSVSEIFELAPEEQAEFGEPKHSRLVCVGLLFADLECPIGPGTEIRPTGVVPFAHHFSPVGAPGKLDHLDRVLGAVTLRHRRAEQKLKPDLVERRNANAPEPHAASFHRASAALRP